MAGQKKKLRQSEETQCFPKYYIGWMGIGNCGQKTSTKYVHNTCVLETSKDPIEFLGCASPGEVFSTFVLS